MAVITNYSYLRNEPTVLAMFGLEQSQNRQTEQNFLNMLAQSEASLPSVCIVMGGFMDCYVGFGYHITSFVRKYVGNHEACHMYYREHYEDADVRFLVEHYAKWGKKVIVIGHSWGGSSLIMHVAKKISTPLDLAITIDPVGIFRPKERITSVGTWVNAYVDYKHANYSLKNNVARVGSPWCHCKYADYNYSSNILHHHKAGDIFEKYVAVYCEELLKTL